MYWGPNRSVYNFCIRSEIKREECGVLAKQLLIDLLVLVSPSSNKTSSLLISEFSLLKPKFYYTSYLDTSTTILVV